MQLDNIGYTVWYRTNNLADFQQVIAYGNSLDLDYVARSLERWGASTQYSDRSSYRRLSRDTDLREWCKEAFKNLSPKLKRASKRTLW